MYLKRLELIGFKSFADRTELEFVPGVTAVVGPNGSGKSNISDAIRWVLGEQSAKSLRGAKMEDVIFAGSETRKPVNFAEVSLTLDNADQSLGIEYSEVTVTRRVYRSGESEYAINNRACRLKDIMELFMDTGVGKEAYSIIGQGRIEEILSTKPEDRRGIFEEAAGIVKYKTRKREAEKKLEETEQNLVRIRDIITELADQEGPLREQAERAKTYQSLKQQVTQHEVGLYVQQIEAVHTRWQEAKERVDELKEKLAALSAEASAQEAKLEQARFHVAQLDQSIEELQQTLLAVSEEVEKAEGQGEVLKERQRNLATNRQHTLEQMHRLTEKQRLLEAQIAEEQQRLVEAETRLAEATRSLKEAEVSYAQMGQALQDDVEALKSDYFETLNEQASLRNNIRHAEQLIQTQQARVERLLQDQARLEREEQERLKKQETQERDLAALEREMADTLAQYRQLMETIRERQLAAKTGIGELHQLEQRKEAAQSRLDLIKEMQSEFAGFQQGVKEILKAREKGFPGIHGAVAELLSVPEKVETAVEVALGGALQNVVVDDEATGRKAIAYLKQHNLGRATFLPLDVIRPRSIPESDRRIIHQQAGVVGIASQLVQSEERYRTIVESLLGNVIVTETLEQANRVARSCGYRYRVVTLDGDLVNAGGSMTGGALKKNTANLLGRGRQAEELEALLRKLNQTIHAKRTAVETLTAEIRRMEQAQEQLRSHAETLRVKEQELKGLVQQCEAEGRTIAERLFVLKQDLHSYQQEMEEASGTLREQKQRLVELSQIEQQLSEQISAAEAKRKEHLSHREELNERITALKVAVAQAQQEHQSRSEQVTRLNQQLDGLKREWAEANSNLSQLDEQEQESREALRQLEGKIGELRQDKERVAALIQERRGERSALFASQEQLEAEVKEGQKQRKAVEDQLHQEEVKVNRCDVELDHLLHKLSAEYELSYELASQRYRSELDIQELQQIVAGLKQEISDLGTINLGAIEEFERLSERLAFLRTQEADLQEAKQMLYQVIAEMDEEMARRFRETFEQIREQFREVFRELFGGGRADLLLSQPDNILETGIDIVAQPPGKKLQNLALLSGGERAFTAMALLFAILKVKPVPFCVLDEVEAALDEANVSRFAEYMHRFSKQTQFICVTHRKGTMENADVLYGITMQESGVSKLVSVRLEDTKKLIESAS